MVVMATLPVSAARSTWRSGSSELLATAFLVTLPAFDASSIVSPAWIGWVATRTSVVWNWSWARVSAPRTYMNTRTAPSAATSAAATTRILRRSIDDLSTQGSIRARPALARTLGIRWGRCGGTRTKVRRWPDAPRAGPARSHARQREVPDRHDPNGASG